MIPRSLAQVAAATDGSVVGDPTTVVDEVSTDSRRMAPGALFVALRGEHVDGHDFAAGAVAAGAGAVVVEDAAVVPDGAAGVVVSDSWTAIGALGGHVRDVVDPGVVAITGSVGKTTTKDLVAAAVGGVRDTVAAAGSFNNELGVPLTLLSLRGHTEVLVVEIGARGPGHIASLTPLVRPDVSVVTAVAGAHLEMFGDLDGVARAKGELVEALAPDGTAVLNAADERVWAMRDRTDAHVVGYGAGGAVTAHDVVVDTLARTRATVRTPWGRVAVQVPLPGRHNLDNALAAVAVGGVLGVPLDDLADGIATATVSQWRSEVGRRADGLVVLNDSYNANPTSTLAALDTLAAMRRPAGRLVAVLGFMAELGQAETSGHEDVGHAAGTIADLVVVSTERSGAARLACETLAACAASVGAEVVEADGPAAAAAALRGRVGRDDVVLLKASRSSGLEAAAAALLGDDTPREDGRRPARSVPSSGSVTDLASSALPADAHGGGNGDVR